MAGTTVEQVQVVIDADGSKLKKAVDSGHKSLTALGGVAKTAGKALGASFAAAGVSIAAFSKSSISSYNEANNAAQKFQNSAANQKWSKDGQAALNELASDLQDYGVIEGDAITAGQAQLGTFNLTSDAVAKLTPAMADLAANQSGAATTSEQMANYGNLVGKAMQGNVGALTRYGVTLTKTQQEQIKNGDEMERASAVADALAANYGGLNTRMGDTAAGGMAQVTNAFGDVQEAFGAMLAGEGDMQGLTDSIEYFVTVAMDELPAMVKTFSDIIPVAIEALTAQIGPLLSDLIPVFIDGFISIISGVVKAMPQIVQTLTDALPALIQGLIDLVIYLAQNITKIIEPLVKALPQIITQIANALPVLVPELVKGFVQLFIMLVTHLPEIIMALINAIPQIISALVQGFAAAWGPLMEAFSGFFGSVWEKIKEIFGAVGKWFGDIFRGAVDAIKKAFGVIGNFFQGVWNGVKKIFSGVKDFFVGIGKNIGDVVGGAIKGVINGVLGFVSGIVNVFIGAINGAISLINLIPGVNIGKLETVDWQMKAHGGLITGAGSATSDSIPTMLSNGEYVIKAATVDRIGVDNLDFINDNGVLPATGGANGVALNVTTNNMADPIAFGMKAGAIIRNISASPNAMVHA